MDTGFCCPASVPSLRRGPRFYSIFSPVVCSGLPAPASETDPDWSETNRYPILLASATDSRTDE